MQIFHYIQPNIWPKIKQDGLEPRSQQRLTSGFPKATYAFLQPVPDDLINGPFPTLWDEFKGTRGDLLIEITVDPEDPDILVGDAGYIEGYLYREHHAELDIQPKYKITDEKTALDLYRSSLIPLKEYLDQKPDYLLLEVQIRRIISGEEDRLRISEIQPILEDEIGSGKFPDNSMYPLPQILKLKSELRPWIDSLGNRGDRLRESLQRLERQIDYFDHHNEETISIK